MTLHTMLSYEYFVKHRFVAGNDSGMVFSKIIWHLTRLDTFCIEDINIGGIPSYFSMIIQSTC